MGELSLTVTNFEKEKGQLIISIFDNPAAFPAKGKEVKRLYIDKINIDKTTVEIDLPEGYYAIALLHDINMDGECNFNWIGIPVEGYGFSQNVKPIISIPSFEDTMFYVGESKSIEIELIQ